MHQNNSWIDSNFEDTQVQNGNLSEDVRRYLRETEYRTKASDQLVYALLGWNQTFGEHGRYRRPRTHAEFGSCMEVFQIPEFNGRESIMMEMGEDLPSIYGRWDELCQLWNKEFTDLRGYHGVTEGSLTAAVLEGRKSEPLPLEIALKEGTLPEVPTPGWYLSTLLNSEIKLGFDDDTVDAQLFKGHLALTINKFGEPTRACIIKVAR